MKVQCDVCAAEAASVFCCADEAALCDACDRRVHRANKLAGKHRRFSLLNPTAPRTTTTASGSAHQPPPPVCDICQEKRGLLFCKEDRAILCRDCDVSVHTASQLTMRHTRFLLTGVRLSAEPAAACPASTEDDENTSSSFGCRFSADSDAAAAAPPAPATSNDGSDSSSISEYLTKTLPGWHVEDFLVDEAAAAAAASAATTVGGVSADASSYHQGGLAGLQHGYSSWMAQEQLFCDAATAGERWVPQVYAGMPDGKRPRTTSASSSSYCQYW